MSNEEYSFLKGHNMHAKGKRLPWKMVKLVVAQWLAWMTVPI
jgi:hypothetical protein